MKRLLYMTIVVMLFSTSINVILTLNQIQINNNTKIAVHEAIEGQKVGHQNQELIIKNQKDIFTYSTNITKHNMDILQGMLNNETHLIVKALGGNQTK